MSSRPHILEPTFETSWLLFHRKMPICTWAPTSFPNAITTLMSSSHNCAFVCFLFQISILSGTLELPPPLRVWSSIITSAHPHHGNVSSICSDTLLLHHVSSKVNYMPIILPLENSSVAVRLNNMSAPTPESAPQFLSYTLVKRPNSRLRTLFSGLAYPIEGN